LLECVNINASKGNAVKWIAERYNIKQEEICAIGDSENDNSMIEYAGLGVAMGNAMEITKKVANVVCDTNNNNGVAKFIKEYLLD
ncbi:MAG: HAD-IIB family hydrolase, partial [Clostridia bacterium]|nr:HAD-IIB family hydrolase [Clostridia bacterium]